MRGGGFIDEADSTDDELYGQCDEGDDPCCQAEGIGHRGGENVCGKAPSESLSAQGRPRLGSARCGFAAGRAGQRCPTQGYSQTAASRVELGTRQNPPGPNRG